MKFSQTPQRLLVYLTLTSGILSALLVNDIGAGRERNQIRQQRQFAAPDHRDHQRRQHQTDCIVVDGLSDTGLPDAIYRHLQPMFGSHVTAQAWNLTWFSVAGSNFFSNVPFVLVAGKWIARFADPGLMWKVLTLATTFAGNLTIIGSVANMIVVESAREHLEIGFWDYARFGIPITILTTVAGTFVLLVLP